MLKEVLLYLGSAITALGAITAAFVAARANIRAKQLELEAKQREAETPPFEILAQRVGRLERQVETLFQEQWVDRSFIRRLISERDPASPLPHPVPEWLLGEDGQPTYPLTPSSIIQRRNTPSSQQTPTRAPVFPPPVQGTGQA